MTSTTSSEAAPAVLTATDISVVVERLAQPFTRAQWSPTPSTVPARAIDWTVIVGVAWACGFAAVALTRVRGWRRIRAVVRASRPLTLASPIPVRESRGVLEPGVVGIWRPVLLVPEGIERHLTPAQLRAVLEHERCHVQRHDNLTSAIHMVVEAVFWFHPLVWWIGARMVAERERACDEQVLRVCGEPQVYAESILSVCKLYVESPVACVSGVTGADLKARITAIMGNRVGQRLNLTRKVALGAAALLALAAPLAAGMVTAPLRRSEAPANARAAGQDAKTNRSSTFDVVSIRPCEGGAPAPRSRVDEPAGARRGGAPWAAQISPGYVYWSCITAAQLVDQAYSDLDRPLLNAAQPGRIYTAQQGNRDPGQPARVQGGPAWVQTEKFTVEARASVALTNSALQGRSSSLLVGLPAPMSAALRAMLEERFQVKVRRATAPRDLYAMTIAQDGLRKDRFRAAMPDDCVSADDYFAADPAGRGTLRICGRYRVVQPLGLEFTGVTLPQLAAALSDSMERVVVDQTGVDGTFTFTLKPASGADLTLDERFIIGLAALGLKLEPTRGAGEYLLIDSIQRPKPGTPNRP
jgi:uncharacterized protein (TIGR03435 family)